MLVQQLYNEAALIITERPWQDVCVSVCLSLTRRYCVKTTKHITKLFLPSDSHTILVISYQTLWNIWTATPLMGASNVGGMNFQPVSRFISV